MSTDPKKLPRPEQASVEPPEPAGPEWCEVCTYPLKVDKQGRCIQCVEEAEEKAKKDAAARAKMSLALGGDLAVDQFTFEKFTVTDGTELAYVACKNFHGGRSNLFLHGKPGLGKSHLATAAIRPFIKGGGIIRHSVQILREVRNAMKARTKREGDVVDHYIRQPVLVIDDIGVENDSAFAMSTLWEIIHGRVMAHRNGLIVTSNLSLDELADKFQDDRITSRLAGLCRDLELTGEDYRLRNRRKT